jgi:S-DNA-T family DNA segregation ATPase FtsK/SpoIIIE
MKLHIFTRFPRLREIAGVLCLFLAAGWAAALATYSPHDPSFNSATSLHPPHNAIGLVGSFVADACYQCFGLVAWMLPALAILIGWRWARNRSLAAAGVRFFGYTLMTVSVAAGASILSSARPYEGAFAAGGVSGQLVAARLTDTLNPMGSLLLLSAAFILSLYLVSAFSLTSTSDAVESWFASRVERFRNRRSDPELIYVPPEPHPTTVALSSPGLEADLAPDYPFEPPPIRDQVMAEEAAAYMRRGSGGSGNSYRGGAAAVEEIDELPPWEPDPDEIPIHSLPPEPPPIQPPAPAPKKASKRSQPMLPNCFELPPLRLLHPQGEREGYDAGELKDTASRIKAKLEEFSVKGNVVQINPGPVVTTFEFKPDAGVKIARITTLSEDLCLGLQAESILIERIPGKPTVGIEVPNTRREMIGLRQMIESEEFQHSPSRLTIALGKDISGRIRISELEKMPHLLIAGSTGSGKSVMLNCLIMSTLYKSTPDEVRMILVDPKRVELGIYDGIPHLLTPVITEPKKAVNALRNAVLEMERRLKLLASYGVRNIDQFNKKVRLNNTRPLALFPKDDEDPQQEEKTLPYILIVIDELADLMMVERAGAEASVIRLAQMARAVGIHLVLATQRPSVDVITGLIKANFPARISFRVATRVDSRTVLDVMGAEHLLGKGDMLFLPAGSSRLLRVHGAFVTETEITDVVDFWRDQAQPDYDESFLIAPPSEDDTDEAGDDFDGEEDPMYREAVKVILEMGKASTSILQRRLRLGYGRAARILDHMQQEGIIGPPDGSRPRDVLRQPGWLDEE